MLRFDHGSFVNVLARALSIWLVCLLILADSGLAQVVTKANREATEDITTPTELRIMQTEIFLDQVVDPETYRIGPGDVLAINIWGEQPQELKVTVTPEATVLVPAVGTFSVENLTLAQAKDSIKRHLASYYPSAGFSTTLIEIRRFRVSVIGSVGNPGLHTVTAATRASEVLDAAGLTGEAKRRDTQLLRGEQVLPVDLDAYERLGRLELNPYLVEGDVVKVPARDAQWNAVSVTGAVRAPNSFEYTTRDDLGTLIDLAYGLNADADTTRVELWRFAEGRDTAQLVVWPAQTTFTDWSAWPLQPDDRLIVRSKETYRQKKSVEIQGEVTRPGLYVFTGDSIMLRDVIDSAGGITPKADLKYAVITRYRVPFWSEETRNRYAVLPPDLRSQTETDLLLADALSIPGRVVTDFSRLLEDHDESYNVALVDGDRVTIPRRTESVNVIGRVVQPGLVGFQPNADLNYYLNRAGGFSWQADRGKTFLVKGATGAAVKKGKIKIIEAGDTVVIPTKRPKNLWASIRETLVVLSSLATVYLVVDQATQ